MSSSRRSTSAPHAGCSSSSRRRRAPARRRWSSGWCSACPICACRGPTRRGRRGPGSRTASTIISSAASASRPWSGSGRSSSGPTCSATTTARPPPTPRPCWRAARTSCWSSTSRAPGRCARAGSRPSASSCCRPRRRSSSSGCAAAARTARSRFARRLEVARREVGEYAQYEYVVVNDELDAAVERLAGDRRRRAGAGDSACGRRRGSHHRNVSFMKSTSQREPVRVRRPRQRAGAAAAARRRAARGRREEDHHRAARSAAAQGREGRRSSS